MRLAYSNKLTLSVFKELAALDVAPECDTELIKNQVEFRECRSKNQDRLAKTKAMDRLLKLITSDPLWDIFLISRARMSRTNNYLLSASKDQETVSKPSFSLL